MYLPTAFQEDRIETLHAAMRGTGLATLVTLHADGMIASHVPMLLDPDPAPYGTLVGHVARPNPQATPDQSNVHALAIFQGTEGYITPSWYETKQRTGKVVPTWNYIAVHAYGPLTLFDDAERLLQVVTRLTEREEAHRATPWAVTDAPDDFVAGMLKAIIGFTIPIARLEGKWKMSQNRPAQDVAGVITGLRADGRQNMADAVTAAKR
ncbi:MAG: FMN-binding negative transcriptional regulator [Acetobacteraceae bacterium]